MRVSRRGRVQRLRRKGVERGVDRVGPSGLQSAVVLKAQPSDIALADVVIQARRLDLLVIVAGMRHALAMGAAVAVRGGCTAAVKGAAENREWRPGTRSERRTVE